MPSVSTVIAICVLGGLLLACTRRFFTSVVGLVFVLAFILFSSNVKQHYLGLALTFADLKFFLAHPAENSKLFLNYPFLGVALGCLITLFIAFLMFGWRHERPFRAFAIPRTGAALRACTAIASVVLGIASSIVATNSHANRANDGDAYSAFFALCEMQHPAGLMGRLNVFFDNRDLRATLPPARQQMQFFFEHAATEAAVPEIAMPDILMVLEESTFDPRLARRCTFAECDVAMMHSLEAATRTVNQPLLVHTTGGGTWLAEFAFLSGFDWRIFGRAGAFAPVSLAPRLTASLPKHLHSLGYRTVAIYPVDANFLSAKSAYRHYGFDEFYSAEDLKLSSDWYKTHDRTVFDAALAIASRSRDEHPLFIFALTIRNHGPHGESSELIPASYRNLERKSSAELADYLARLNDSSVEYLELARAWLHSPQHRVIGWFGDHQPEMAWDLIHSTADLDTTRFASNVAVTQLKYLTRYQLSANFSGTGNGMTSEALDIAFLGAELLAFSGLPLDAGSAAARKMVADCRGMLLECDNHELVNNYVSYRIHELGSVQ